METIKKLFIKNYKDTQNEKVRTNYGIVAGIVGMLTNLVLFVIKIIIGIIGNSMSIITDAVNSLSDMSSSFITVFGFKLSSKPADEDHPYGHARYEYLSSLMIAIVMILIGILLLKSSIEKIISNEPTKVSYITFVVLIISIFLKLFQMLLYKNFGKSIHSETLILSSVDSRNDIISTIFVLISSIIIYILGETKISVDGVFGTIVSLFVTINSVTLLRDTINPLLGEKPNPDLVKSIKDFITSYDGVYGIHDLMVHNYGEKINITTAHVEVSSKVNVMISHELVDQIEKDFKHKFGGLLTIHIDPIEVDNPEIIDLKTRIESAVKSINSKLSIHDFRMVKGVNSTNLIFDLVIPYGLKNITKENILEIIDSEINNGKMHYNFVVEVDNS